LQAQLVRHSVKQLACCCCCSAARPPSSSLRYAALICWCLPPAPCRTPKGPALVPNTSLLSKRLDPTCCVLAVPVQREACLRPAQTPLRPPAASAYLALRRSQHCLPCCCWCSRKPNQRRPAVQKQRAPKKKNRGTPGNQDEQETYRIKSKIPEGTRRREGPLSHESAVQILKSPSSISNPG